LGHSVSANGVRISDSKTKAIRKMAAPSNRKALQRLLGLMNYFRRHIANFSTCTYNMRQLLKHNTKFQWTQDCEKELEDIKHATLPQS